MIFKQTRSDFLRILDNIKNPKLRGSIKVHIEKDLVYGVVDVCDEQTLIDLIHTDFWPLALPESAIVRCDRHRFYRALSILGGDCMCRDSVYAYDDTQLEGPSFFPDHPLHRKKFIDFGCGDGLCVDVARQYSGEVLGYDIHKHDVWDLRQTHCTDDFDEVREAGPFEVALLHDVLDHAKRPNVLLAQLNSILAQGAAVFVRCHPWSSIHGGHLYADLNKAFAHWVLPQPRCLEQAVPIVDPLEVYPRLFERAGFSIESTFIQPAYQDLFQSTDVANVLTDKTYDGHRFTIEQYLNSIWFEFVDYKLKKITRADTDLSDFTSRTISTYRGKIYERGMLFIENLHPLSTNSSGPRVTKNTKEYCGLVLSKN